MRKLMRNRKAMAWVVLMTFLFTSIMPTGTVFAATYSADVPYTYQFYTNNTLDQTKFDENSIVKINDSDGSFADYSTEERSVVIGLNSAESIKIHIPTGVQAKKELILGKIEEYKQTYPDETLKTFIPCGVSASTTAGNLAVVNAVETNADKIKNTGDDDTEHFYVLYKNIDNYYGKQIDLKVSIKDYELGTTGYNQNRFGYKYLIGLQTVGEHEEGFETTSLTPGIAVAGIKSVTLKYEFFESGTFDERNHKGTSISVKGSTNYYDVDACQGVIVDGTCKAIYMAAGAGEPKEGNGTNINGIYVLKDTCALAVSKTVTGYHIKDVTDKEAHYVDNSSVAEGRVELGYLNAAFSEGFEGSTLNRTFTFTKSYAGIYHSGVSTVRTTTIEGTKTWEDDNDRDGKRPESITINLFADGGSKPYQIATLHKKDFEGKNDWSYQFINLPKYNADGKPIKYTVTENEVPDYTTKIDGFTVTNTHTPETTKVEGTKTWIDDGDDHSNDSITVNLFGVETNYTTKQIITAADDWKYEFTDLPKYKNGKEINYVVTENNVPGYQTIYEVGTYNIFNVKDDNPNLKMNFPVEKVWEDEENKAGKRPEKIVVELKVNGQTTDSAILWDANNWKATFTDLPRYADDGTTNVYTVEEISIPEGYVSAVVTTMNGATITNKLCAGDEGEFTVSKKVEGNLAPADDHAYNFELEVEATETDWTALLVHERNELKEANDNALADKATAQANLDEAIGLFGAEVYSTGSAYKFVMKGTSPSAYIFTDKEDGYAKTTDSAYGFFFGDAAPHDNADGIIETVVNGIVALANEVAELANPVNFLNALQEKVTLDDVAVVFDEVDAQNLFTKARELFEADRQVQITSAAMLTFEENLPTTTSAITLVMTPITYAEDGTAQKGTTVTENLQPDAENKYFDGEKYIIPFNLLKNMDYRFAIKATTGTSIQYVVKEVGGYLTDDYLHTMIGEDIDDDLMTATQTLTEKSTPKLHMFTNVYDNYTAPPTDPWTPPYVPPTDPTDPPVVIDDPETPLADVPEEDVEIVEPGVPLADAPEEEEIFEEEIPLGDAPPTGDANNAIPFVVLMMAAVAGMVITRKRFN